MSPNSPFQTAVIVLTSPGREDNLRYCLRSLRQQREQNFELIVVDDGSAAGQQVLAQEWDSTCQYLWRSNDYCMSRSYNLAVAASTAAHLVFCSSDILLNPHALGYYRAYFHHHPDWVIWGYFGNVREDERASELFPGRRVNLLDSRLGFKANGAPACDPVMIPLPQAFAWGGNWALARTQFEASGGFDEGFQGWGLEDVDFANRLVRDGVQQAFSLDVWAEHQVHEWQAVLEVQQRNRARVGAFMPAQQEPALLYDARQSQLRVLLQS